MAAGGFDVITMWSVLAHLARPVEDLTMLRSLLAPDGVLLLLTVNAGSLKLKRDARDLAAASRRTILLFSSPGYAAAYCSAAPGFRAVVMPLVQRAGRAGPRV